MGEVQGDWEVGMQRKQTNKNSVIVLIKISSESKLSYMGMFLFLRYIKETNIKNDPNELNNLIKKNSDVLTWTPRPGATLDLGRMLKDPTDRCGLNTYREKNDSGIFSIL